METWNLAKHVESSELLFFGIIMAFSSIYFAEYHRLVVKEELRKYIDRRSGCRDTQAPDARA